MKNLLWLVCLAIVSTSSVWAQESQLHAPQSDEGSFNTELQSQPHHESAYPRYATPQELVHRKAALRAAQRRERMAINARFGYSPSRPPASPVPWMGSPTVPPTAYRVYAPYPGFAFPRYYSRF